MSNVSKLNPLRSFLYIVSIKNGRPKLKFEFPYAMIDKVLREQAIEGCKTYAYRELDTPTLFDFGADLRTFYETYLAEEKLEAGGDRLFKMHYDEMGEILCTLADWPAMAQGYLEFHHAMKDETYK